MNIKTYFIMPLLSVLLYGNLSFGATQSPLLEKQKAQELFTTNATLKAQTELKLRKLRSALQNNKIRGDHVEQILLKIDHLQNQLSGQR